jgi:hypothetical protein
MASLLTGKRLDSWQDDTADAFGFEAKAIAARLFRWLAHMREQVSSTTKLVTVHVVDTSGQEKMVVVRPGLLARFACERCGRQGGEDSQNIGWIEGFRYSVGACHCR